VRASDFRSVSETVSIPEDFGHQCGWRTCHSRRGILDLSRKFHRKILDSAGLLIECQSIPLWSDRDHDLVELFGTLGFKCVLLAAHLHGGGAALTMAAFGVAGELGEGAAMEEEGSHCSSP
jgi:hypothetical protein